MKVGNFQINWGFRKWCLGDTTVVMGGTMDMPILIRPPFTTHLLFEENSFIDL